MLANLDKRRGGLGYGLHGDDPLSSFLIDEHLAYGNPSTAHCFQVHSNALMMIDAMAEDAQVEKWIEPTIKRGALIPGAGAALEYTRKRSAGKDPHRQLRFGELKSMLDASRLILYNAVRMFKRDPDRAMIAAHEAKWMAKETAGEGDVERR